MNSYCFFDLPRELQFRVSEEWSYDTMMTALQASPMMALAIPQTSLMAHLRLSLSAHLGTKGAAGTSPGFDEVLSLMGFTEIASWAAVLGRVHVIRLRENLLKGKRRWHESELRLVLLALHPFPIHFKKYAALFVDVLTNLLPVGLELGTSVDLIWESLTSQGIDREKHNRLLSCERDQIHAETVTDWCEFEKIYMGV
jgi:hypothetical protein